MGRGLEVPVQGRRRSREVKGPGEPRPEADGGLRTSGAMREQAAEKSPGGEYVL